ncbi:MAG: type II secretion system protein [Candidatus Omnitrophica bacterium]|nr:type II secretion system protein [Candidatus Omnitrophota bacterium]
MRYRKGFTIIELGIVIFLIGAIIVALTPFIREAKRKTCAVRCIHNLQNIGLALRSYALAHDEAVPKDLSLLWTEGYLAKENSFDCPFTSHKGTAKEPDYIYDAHGDFRKPDNIPVVYDKPSNHPDKSFNVLYLNGDIEHQEDSATAEKQRFGAMAE